MESISQPRSGSRREDDSTPVLLTIAAIAVLIHFATNLGLGGYGYFRDELYYIACSRHLAAGYVDHPSLSILLLWVELHLFGSSLFALRIFPALAAGAMVFLTGRLAREMGGGRFAQMLAALAVLIAGVYLAICSFYSMNALDLVFWAACALVLARIVNTGEARLWLWFGLIAGLGLENKLSVLFLCFGLAVGLVLTENRRFLPGKWLWLGGAIAILLLVPNLIWEVRNGWPTSEFVHNAQLYKNNHASIPAFALSQVILLNPFNAPIWLIGLYYCLFANQGRRWRIFAWIYLTVFAVLAIQGGKPYYAAPVYPLLLAAGAVAIEQFAAAREWGVIFKRGCAVALVIGGIIAAPLAIPVLPPRTLAAYAAASGVTGSQDTLVGERQRRSALMQPFADRFGWPEMVETVASAYASLPPGQRARAAIATSNYGEAGAIDFFGSRYGLPNAISGHNNYWLWGPGSYEPEVVVTVGVPRERLEAVCGQVTQAATTSCDYCMPFEDGAPIFVCRGLKRPLSTLWPTLRSYN
jgi:4-amino-4-deoxy-L-arabinose transferase-like glycosyltransferase